MWKRVLLAVAVVVVLVNVGFAALAALQPDVLRIERTRVVAGAAPADVWPLVSDLRGFVRWSPWEELDPGMKKDFSDPSSGPGAWYAWQGNKDVGSGKMEIATVEPQKGVTEKLHFLEPFPSEAESSIALVPSGDGTQVTWAIEMKQGFVPKAFGLVMDMDAMLGADFEKGLAKLDTVATLAAEERKAAEAKAAALP
jgi:hypothetical protein